MITKTFVKKLKNDIESVDRERAYIIRATHGLVRESKHAIFKIHRNDLAEVARALGRVAKEVKGLIKKAEKVGLRSEASLKAAVEEYLEAQFLLNIIQKRSLVSRLSVDTLADEQLSALADLTGELVRAATLEVTKGHLNHVKQYRDATEELFGVLLQMDLRGQLRQKRDDARRNLKRLEEILYDVSLKQG